MKSDRIIIQTAKPRGFIIAVEYHSTGQKHQWIAMDIPELLATIESLTSPEPARAAQD